MAALNWERQKNKDFTNFQNFSGNKMFTSTQIEQLQQFLIQMGSNCSKAQNIEVETKQEVQHQQQVQRFENPVYTVKLNVHGCDAFNYKPQSLDIVNESILEITTERNLQESIPQNQLLGKKYFDDTITINKSNHLIFSQSVDVLKSLGVKDAESQKQKFLKKEDEYFDDDQDLLQRTEIDFKFQQPFTMKMVDKQQQSVNLKGKLQQQQQQQQSNLKKN